MAHVSGDVSTWDIAELRALLEAEDGDTAVVREVDSRYVYDEEEYREDDGGGVIIKPSNVLAANAGRWVLDQEPFPGRGNLLFVDARYGDDGRALRNRQDRPYKTVNEAILRAQLGDTIWIYPGTYELPLSITIPAGVSIRGVNRKRVTLQMTGVLADTSLVTMGQASTLMEVSLRLASASHFTLKGILFPGTTSLDAQVRNVNIEVDNSGASTLGTSNVYGIHSNGTGAPNRGALAAENVMIVVASAGLGNKRGMLVDTGANNFHARNVDAIVTTAGGAGSYIAAETNFAGARLTWTVGTADGPSSDISQTLGTLELGNVDLIHSTANAKNFTAINVSFNIIWADPGSITIGTRFGRPGSATASIGEVFLNLPRKAVIKRLHVRATIGPGAARTDTWTIRKNGVDTILTVSMTGAATIASDTANSVSYASGDDLSLKVVGSPGSTTTDWVATAETY